MESPLISVLEAEKLGVITSAETIAAMERYLATGKAGK
jgi:hypothetical protein